MTVPMNYFTLHLAAMQKSAFEGLPRLDILQHCFQSIPLARCEVYMPVADVWRDLEDLEHRR